MKTKLLIACIAGGVGVAWAQVQPPAPGSLAGKDRAAAHEGIKGARPVAHEGIKGATVVNAAKPGVMRGDPGIKGKTVVNPTQPGVMRGDPSKDGRALTQPAGAVIDGPQIHR